MCPQGFFVHHRTRTVYGRARCLVGRARSFICAESGRSKTPPSAADSKQELIKGDERWYSSTAVTADLDGNGHLDLIVGNYLPDGSRMIDENDQGVETLHDSLARSGTGGGLRFFRFVSATSGRHPTVRFDLQKDSIADELTLGWTYAIGPADLERLAAGNLRGRDFGPDRLLHNRSTPGHFPVRGLARRADDGLAGPHSCSIRTLLRAWVWTSATSTAMGCLISM